MTGKCHLRLSQSPCPNNTPPATLSCIEDEEKSLLRQIDSIIFFQKLLSQPRSPIFVGKQQSCTPMYTQTLSSPQRSSSGLITENQIKSRDNCIYSAREGGRGEGDLSGALRDEKNNKPKLDQDAGRRKAPASRTGFDLKRVANVINKLWMNLFTTQRRSLDQETWSTYWVFSSGRT